MTRTLGIALPLLGTSLLLTLAGCAVGTDSASWDGAADSEFRETDAEIIGGTTLTPAQRRTLGLIDVNGGGCSGSLVNPDWVLTASHCLDHTTPGNNSFGAPKTDGTLETRTGVVVQQMGTSDVSIVKLSARTPNWPIVSRTARTSGPSDLVGQSVTCYGRGVSGYEADGTGFVNDGLWRQVSRTVQEVTANGELHLVDDGTGRQIIAPGDSGGLCAFSNQAVAVNSWIGFQCADGAHCGETVTRVTDSFHRTMAQYAGYINNATNRVVTSFAPIALKVKDAATGATHWEAYDNTARPGANLQGGIVQLRGALKTSGTDTNPFTLPAAYAPSSDVYVSVDMCNGKKGRLKIQSNGVVNVNTEGAFSDAQCFTSLEGVSYAVSNTSFTALPLLNGWTNAPFSTRNAAVRDVSGLVRFEGAIATSGTNMAPFTLPAQFRPTTNVYVPVGLCNSKKGRLLITSSGSVTVQPLGPVGDAQCFTSLEGVSFAKDNAIYGNLTLQNGWTNAPFSTRVAADRDDNGIVRLRGAVATTGSSNVAFTLSAAVRPATPVYVPLDLCGAAKGRLTLLPTGEAIIQKEGLGSFASMCFASLEGVSFGL